MLAAKITFLYGAAPLNSAIAAGTRKIKNRSHHRRTGRSGMLSARTDVLMPALRWVERSNRLVAATHSSLSRPDLTLTRSVSEGCSSLTLRVGAPVNPGQSRPKSPPTRTASTSGQRRRCRTGRCWIIDDLADRRGDNCRNSSQHIRIRIPSSRSCVGRNQSCAPRNSSFTARNSGCAAWNLGPAPRTPSCTRRNWTRTPRNRT